MKCSELVAKLQAYIHEYGDHEVVDTYGDPVEEPEAIDGECVLVDKA